ncbi:MAG: hypothetical protein NZZ41_05370 [Candidatus Dojkabacteria bacterium]|nr:hypothetical protein [Candidatus Dojkabacteria bacterium]
MFIFLNEKSSHINVFFRNMENEKQTDSSGIYAFPIKYALNKFYNQISNTFFSRRYIFALVDKNKNKFIVSNEEQLYILELVIKNFFLNKDLFLAKKIPLQDVLKNIQGLLFIC